MNKNKILKLALFVLPLVVVAIAISPGSVHVYEGDVLRVTNFTEAVYGSNVGWCAPVMLLVTYGIFGLFVFYLILKKKVLVRIIRAVAFLAICLGACPVLVPGEVRVVPNVFAAIVMCAVWGVAHLLVKDKNEEAVKPQGRRLSKR